MSDILELENLPKDHLSYTQLNMYQRCPFQFQLRYCDEIKVPVKPSLVLGIGIHRAEETNFKTKLESGNFPKLNDVKQIYAETCEKLIKELEIDWKTNEDTPEKIKNDGIGLVVIYDPYAKKIKPIAVEESFEVKFQNTDYTLVGRRDVRTSKAIIDLKTSRRSFNIDEIENDDQLTGYQVDLRSNGIENLFIHGLIRTKDPKIQIIKMALRTQERVDDFLLNMAKIALLIRTGIFPKRKDWKNCSWCGYRIYGYCK